MFRGWWTLCVLALVLASTSGCGAPAGCGPGVSTDVTMFTVPTLVEEGNFWGMTHYGCDHEPTVVEISRETPIELLGRVVAHEMLHAAGLVEHEASQACYLHATVFPGQPLVPCTNEIERLEQIGAVYTLRVLSSPLVPHAQGAANLWNDYAGREIFVIIDESDPNSNPSHDPIPGLQATAGTAGP